MSAGHSRCRGCLAGATLALLLALAAGLAGGSGQPARAQASTLAAVGQQIVPLKLVKGPGERTPALVPVFINGVGPFAFALDTGSTRSLIDRSIVLQLGLPIVGSEEVAGAMGVETAELAQVRQWRAGTVSLPASTTVFTLDLPAAARAIELAGFLGCDVLGQYGSVTIDWQVEELILQVRS